MFTNKKHFLLSIVILVILLLASCGPSPISVSDISSHPQPDIPVGAEATFSVEAAGKNLSFEWTATSGDFIGSTANASVVYKAPDTYQDVVTVSVTVKDDGGQQITKNLIFKVVDIDPLTETPAPPPTPTNTPTLTSAPTLTQTPTATPTAAECWFNNLIVCSRPPIAVFVPGRSSSSATFINGKLVVDFNNNRNTSAVVLQFDPLLDIQGFSTLELVGASTHEFSFLVEYKVNENGRVTIVQTSAGQLFPATSATITIPITYNGLINEIGFNFFKPGQSAQLTIESIRLRK